MSKAVSQKRKLRQPQPQTITKTSEIITQSNKIKPGICLLSKILRDESPKDHISWRIKRQYSKQLKFSEKTSNSYGLVFFNTGRNKNDQLFRKRYKKTKYLQHLEINTFSLNQYRKSLMSIQRIRSVKVHISSHLSNERLPKILRKLARLNLSALKINMSYYSGGNEMDQLISQTLIKGTRYLSNIKSLTLIFKNSANRNQNISLHDHKIISSQFKRFRKLEKLNLVLKGLPKQLVEGFTQRFDHLQNLKTIRLWPFDSIHGNQTVSLMHEIKSLNSITLYNFIEPNDLFSLTLQISHLRSITIKNDWIFDSKDMPLLRTITAKGLNVVRLHLDFPMDIDTQEDTDFVSNFLSAFSQLRSLHLYLQSEGGKPLLCPIAEQVNKMTQLRDFRVGLMVESGASLSYFFSSIKSLKELRKIAFLFKTKASKAWDRDIQLIYEALRNFLLLSKSISEIKLEWDRFTPQCGECLKLLINDLETLDVFQLGYLSAYPKHEDAHDKILKTLEKTFGKTGTKIKDVTITSPCNPPYRSKKSCAKTMKKIKQVISSNPSINKFTSSIARFGSPFSYDYFR